MKPKTKVYHVSDERRDGILNVLKDRGYGIIESDSEIGIYATHYPRVQIGIIKGDSLTIDGLLRSSTCEGYNRYVRDHTLLQKQLLDELVSNL